MKTNKNLLEAVLFYIKMEYERIKNNQKNDYVSPFENSGIDEDFICSTFEVKTFDWNFDYVNKTLEETPYNFRWRDFKVYWYKHLGRGMEWNREINNDELAQMLDECMEALKKIDIKR